MVANFIDGLMKEKEILDAVNEKLGIAELNEMQKKMLSSTSQNRDIILLSPTGSGKTLAFSIPILKLMKAPTGRIQCVIIAPSRELVVQIAGVIRQMAKGFRVIAVYGGHNVEDEVNSLKVTPDILVATPGRLLDHSVRHTLELLPVRILVLDEFDKTLELGFEEEMEKLMKRFKNVSRIILTSATKAEILPEFLKLDNPISLDFSADSDNLRARMNIRKVSADSNDKLESLYNLLNNINADNDNPEKSIIFLNHRESAERTYDFLKKKKVACGLYHGALSQQDRETSIALFNSGSRPILVATDLASRGLDIEKVQSVIHYHQPLTHEAYTHRNGRTARIDEDGDVYILVGPEEELREFVKVDGEYLLKPERKADLSETFTTLYISGGKREKVSRGDILGFLVKECGVDPGQIGKINVFDHYSLVAVKTEIVSEILKWASTKKLKGEKRKISRLIK